jgi:hypothetical protein
VYAAAAAAAAAAQQPWATGLSTLERTAAPAAAATGGEHTPRTFRGDSGNAFSHRGEVAAPSGGLTARERCVH